MELYSGKVWIVCYFHTVAVLFIQGQSEGSAPKFVQEPSDIIVQKNKPASLHCVAAGSPKPGVTWWKDGVPLSLSSSGTRRRLLTNGTLYFTMVLHSKISKPDEGQYQCVASSPDQSSIIISRKASLKVAGMSSRISVKPSVLQVIDGDTARIYCHIRHSLPEPRIKWKFKDAVIQPSSKYTILGSLRVLQIHNVKDVDRGNYKCVGRNPVNGKEHESTHADLTVAPDHGFPRRPRINVKPAATNATKGSLTILECIATGHPKPRVSWTKDGSPVAVSGHISIVGESNLQFSSVKLSDAGVYSCQAIANKDKVTASARLQVMYPPVLVKRPTDIHSRLEQNIRFECLVDGNPKPRIEWRKDAQLLPEPSDYIRIGDGFLIVEELVQSDIGMYQCLASNEFGNIQASAELFVYKKGAVIPTFTSTLLSSTMTPLPTTIPTTQGKVPTAPRNVLAVALSNQEILVRWSTPLSPHGVILGYDIFYMEENPGGVTSRRANASGTSQSLKLTNLRPNTKYTFYIIAINEYGRGQVSKSSRAQTQDNNLAIPGPPQSLQADTVSESSIRITWMEPATGSKTVSRYLIYYRAAGERTEKKDFTKQTTRLLNNLNAYTKYFIRVFAENKLQKHGDPATVEAVTTSGVPLDAPGDLVLQPDSSGTALFARWSAPSYVAGKLDYYVMLYRKTGTNKNVTKQIPGDWTTFMIRNLEENTTYEAKLAAGTATGQGPFTDDWAKGRTRPGTCHARTSPGKPHNMKVTSRGSVIHVRWQPPIDKVDVCVIKYQLAWGPGSPGPVKVKVDNNTFQYIIGQKADEKLRPNQQYVIKLTAWNKNGNGLDAQEEVDIKDFGRPKEYLTSLKGKAVSPSAILLTWEEPLVTSTKFTYHIWYMLNQKATYSGNTTDREFNVTNLRAATHYLFFVRRNSDDYNTSVSKMTLETRPGAPVDLNGNPSETNPEKLDLHWQPPDEPNGMILDYEIRYSHDRSAKLKLWGKVPVNGSELMKTLTLTVGTKFYIKMRARTRVGWGPYSDLYIITTPLFPYSEKTTAITTTSVASDAAVAKQTGNNFQDKTLWIVIAAVAGLTLIAIIIISVILCKKRSGEDINPRKPPKPTYKQVITNGSLKKKNKNKDEKPPDLWINHTDNMEMKPLNQDPDVTSAPAMVIPMRHLDPDPVDEDPRRFDPERSSFSAHNSDNEGDCPEKEPMLPHGISGQGNFVEPGEMTPSPPTTPIKTSYSPVGRPRTPENVHPSQPYPLTSTPRYDKTLPRSGSYPTSEPPSNPSPRSYTYDADFFGAPNRGVPVYPMPQPSSGSPYRTLPPPVKPKPMVSPNDDIQIPPTYSRQPRVPNGLRTLPPRYDDIMPRKERSDTDTAVADLEKEIAGLEGLMKDLNDITSNEHKI